ncbi:hypothetical protein EIP91_006052 [Steccherinum ochraceum]|uniref:Methyltransferase-like protein 16 n=1 Tax=Steccherinum ochraceum TaxID=92696 RepID=A0A4R0REM7_9APHY|nr:hypothetical protein EIP91_006052 [Steccherinum ochraceum]
MHPRNPYRVPIDFAALAVAYPPLAPYVVKSSEHSKIDFQNDAALRRLTEALLFRDFQVKLTIPDDRLCPPVPNRLNYVLWLEDIVSRTSLAADCAQPDVVGLDIGTGASAIYPLLGCRSNGHWRFIATDIDDTSIRVARSNIEENHLQDRISLVKADETRPIFSLLSSPELDQVTVDFTMCNPPFYESRDEVLRSAEAKVAGPNAVVKALSSHNVDNYAITEFVQGQTRRWAIAWSFTNIHLPECVRITRNRESDPEWDVVDQHYERHSGFHLKQKIGF